MTGRRSAEKTVEKKPLFGSSMFDARKAGLGVCTAETRRAQSKGFLIKKHSELCELRASVVNLYSLAIQDNHKLEQRFDRGTRLHSFEILAQAR
jgi:hypothetical protein